MTEQTGWVLIVTFVITQATGYAVVLYLLNRPKNAKKE